MSTANTSSVFPPPRVPRISTPNPHNRKPSLNRVASPEEIKQSVIVALEEIPVPKVPEEHLVKSQSQTQVSERPVDFSRPTFKNGVPPPPPRPSQSTPKNNVTSNGTSSSHGSPEPGSISSSETLVRSTSPEVHTKSPVVPIRSMFPVWNPNMSVQQQQSYQPQRPAPAYASHRATADISHYDARSVLAPSVRGSASSRAPVPFGMVDVPLDILSAKEPRFSSPKELERLWEATLGTEPNMTIESFDLEMGRTSEATFSFGSTPDTPFYAATTYDTSEISITKICPRKRNVVCDVVLSSIEPPSRRLPPNDGLVSFIFPKMAAMLAINQSNALAEQHGLAPTHRDEVQSAAMKRAAAQEASNLRYNPLAKRYELDHPAVSRNQRDPNFVVSPQSPQSARDRPALHITVQEPETPSQDKPVINVVFPEACRSPLLSAGSGLRSQGIVSPGADIPLASLDFNTNTLHIKANNILELMPSLFAIDSIVSAVVSVAVADRETNVVMGAMDMWLPRPSRLNRASWAGSQRSNVTAGGSVLYATIAEREEAEQEARAAAKTHKKDMKNKPKPRNFTSLSAEEVVTEGGRTWYGKSKGPKKKKQIVIGEFDLEKLGHYQSGSRQGQELPAVTRGLLGFLVTGLKFMVWSLTMIVQFVAWILVALSRGLTSDKF